MKTIVFTDIDGTLLNRKHELTPRTAEALEKADRKGIIIALCSGRAHDGLLDITDRLSFSPFLVTLNGAYILDAGKNVVAEHFFTKEELSELEKIRKTFDLGLLYFPGRHWASEAYDRYYEDEYSIVKRPGTACPVLEYEGRVHKYLTVGPKEANRLFAEEAKKALPHLEIVPSSSRYTEVNTHGCDKGQGILDVCRYAGADVRDTYCFGDYDNDIAMFRTAGVPIAMANAVDKVKSLAKHITLSCDEDGVAVALERITDDYKG
ncbi:MAG: Cof-type HAD-IIB family hydrolase [Bullifex sp.]